MNDNDIATTKAKLTALLESLAAERAAHRAMLSASRATTLRDTALSRSAAEAARLTGAMQEIQSALDALIETES